MSTITPFTPWTALAGGVLIGLSALLLLGGIGRIAGISGIVGNLAISRGNDFWWRLAFTLGLIGGAWSFLSFAPESLLEIHVDAGMPLMLLAGFIVGLGTRLGRGCTSGHGVCGIGRGSPRSLTATVVFMAVAVLVVYGMRHGGL